MSKVQLQGNASGTGIFTIASPNSNTDRTLTLPDSSGTVGLAGAAVTRSQLPTGSLLQVVQGNYANVTSTTSTSYVDTGLSATITPTAASSRILILVNDSLELLQAGTSVPFVIDRNGTKPVDPSVMMSNPTPDGITFSFSYLDSPSSTSALTYKLQFRNENGGYTTRFGSQSAGFTYNTITLMEIAA